MIKIVINEDKFWKGFQHPQDIFIVALAVVLAVVLVGTVMLLAVTVM